MVKLTKLTRSVDWLVGSGQLTNQDPTDLVVDLTDDTGHGVLVATDNIFIQCFSSSALNPITASARLFYRWKNVSLAEYIGIVQSQQ